MDTAVKTAETGYMQRRLVKVFGPLLACAYYKNNSVSRQVCLSRGGGLMVSAVDRAVLGRALAGEIVLCPWARHVTLIVPLSTRLANCYGNLTKFPGEGVGGKPALNLPSRMERCYRTAELLPATETGVQRHTVFTLEQIVPLYVSDTLVRVLSLVLAFSTKSNLLKMM